MSLLVCAPTAGRRLEEVVAALPEELLVLAVIARADDGVCGLGLSVETGKREGRVPLGVALLNDGVASVVVLAGGVSSLVCCAGAPWVACMGSVVGAGGNSLNSADLTISLHEQKHKVRFRASRSSQANRSCSGDGAT